jgi:hypothetical protein
MFRARIDWGLFLADSDLRGGGTKCLATDIDAYQVAFNFPLDDAAARGRIVIIPAGAVFPPAILRLRGSAGRNRLSLAGIPYVPPVEHVRFR